MEQLERDWKGRKKGGGNDCFCFFLDTGMHSEAARA